MKRWRMGGDAFGIPEVIVFGFLLAVVAVSTLLVPHMLGTLNISFIFTNSVEIGLIAIPMTMLMVMGDIDLSVGSILGLSAAVLGELFIHGVPFVLAAILAVVTGVVAGLVNGVLCIKFQLPSLVLTIGTYALYRGLAQVLLGTTSVSVFPGWFVGWNARYVIGILTYPELFLAICIVVGFIVLHRLKFGRQLAFIGANSRAARFSGMRIDRAKLIVFGASGLASALAMLILVSRLQSLDNTAGSGYNLVVITAVLLGGTDFKGGRGTITGSMIAIVLISVFENALELAGISSQDTIAAIGGLLILSVVVDVAMGASRTAMGSRHASKSVGSDLPADRIGGVPAEEKKSVI